MSQADWTLIHAQLHQTLRQRKLLPKQSRVLIALSGGQDSLCLGKLLLDLGSKWQWQLAIAHCDHQWTTDKGIAEWVRQVSVTWDLPFYLETANNLKETEAAARQWRYQALGEIAQEHGFQYVVTGHTRSDRAETFLYNLIRGSGADGLGALTWQRPLTRNVSLVRPILDLYRRETGEFCQQFSLPIWSDEANNNLKYARNRIRQNLIPYLQENFNPQVEKSLSQAAELLKADVEYLELEAESLLRSVEIENKLNRIDLRKAPMTLQRRAIRRFLSSRMSKQPNFSQIEAMVSLIEAPNKSCTSTFPGGAIAKVIGEWIVFS